MEDVQYCYAGLVGWWNKACPGAALSAIEAAFIQVVVCPFYSWRVKGRGVLQSDSAELESGNCKSLGDFLAMALVRSDCKRPGELDYHSLSPVLNILLLRGGRGVTMDLVSNRRPCLGE